MTTSASMSTTMLLLCLSIAVPTHAWWFSLPVASEKTMQTGKELLENFQRDSLDDVCFRRAIDLLHNGCAGSNEAERARFGLALANCHLSRSGLPTYPCEPSTPLRSCTQAMSAEPIAFTTYTTFYAHAEVICQYLSAERFHERTESAVLALHDGVELSQQTLADLASETNSIAGVVREASSQQHELLQQQALLNADVARVAATQRLVADNVAAAHEVSRRVLQEQGRIAEANEQLHARTNTSLGVVHAQLETSLEKEAQLLQMQADAAAQMQTVLAQQDEAIRLGRVAMEQLAEDTRAFSAALAEQHEQVRSVADTVAERIDLLRDVHTAMVDRFSDAHASLRAAALSAAVLLLTASPRTAAARLPALACVALAYSAEQSFAAWTPAIRAATLSVVAVLVIVTATRYRARDDRVIDWMHEHQGKVSQRLCMLDARVEQLAASVQTLPRQQDLLHLTGNAAAGKAAAQSAALPTNPGDAAPRRRSSRSRRSLS